MDEQKITLAKYRLEKAAEGLKNSKQSYDNKLLSYSISGHIMPYFIP